MCIYRERDIQTLCFCVMIDNRFGCHISCLKSRPSTPAALTPSPPTKSFDFRGFDSRKLLILKGGNSHVRIIL